MVPEAKACHMFSTRSGPMSGDCCYLHHHLHAQSWPGTSLIQVSLPTLLQPGHTSPGGTAGGNDKASLAGSSMKGQKQRVVDGRSQRRSWSHGLESHPEGFLLRNPLTGSMQVSKETQRERDKGQGETTGQGSFLLGNDNAPLFQKAFLGYPSLETPPGLLPAPPHSCELDSTHPLHTGHSTRTVSGHDPAQPTFHFSAPSHTKDGGATFCSSRSSSLTAFPTQSLFLRTHDLIPNGAEHKADAHLTFLQSTTFCYRQPFPACWPA